MIEKITIEIDLNKEMHDKIIHMFRKKFNGFPGFQIIMEGLFNDYYYHLFPHEDIDMESEFFSPLQEYIHKRTMSLRRPKSIEEIAEEKGIKHWQARELKEKSE